MFLLRCPKCRHSMKYQGRTSALKGKRKSCVYCGKSYLVKDAIVKEIEK